MRSLSTQKGWDATVRPEILEVADEKTPDGAAPALEQQIIEKEGARILSCIREDAYVHCVGHSGKAAFL